MSGIDKSREGEIQGRDKGLCGIKRFDVLIGKWAQFLR